MLTLVDAYNMAQSLTLDDLQDFTDAFLVLVGMGGTDDEDARDLRRRKILNLDVDVQFTANIPANVQELAQIVTQLSGAVSQKTLLGMLPFITDPVAELRDHDI